jgi:NAD(P)-dependent dehydrogenase (short-subunit alcohol dehydrogenase family)
VSRPGLTAYSTSKAALTGLARSLAVELARDRIRVNCVAPAWVRGEMTEQAFSNMTAEQVAQLEQAHPLGLGDPRDVAHAAAFLLADTGRWITGTTLLVDGGYTAL